MTINTTTEGKQITVALAGRLDTTTAPQLEAELSAVLDGAEALILDMSALEYLSSAGLRVILAAHKRMSRQGGMVVRHVNATIMEVFEVTGFTDILTIESWRRQLWLLCASRVSAALSTRRSAAFSPRHC